MVGERPQCIECVERHGGECSGSENAGVSNEKRGEIPSAESLRFPEEGSSAQGKSGPKPRLKSVGDG